MYPNVFRWSNDLFTLTLPGRAEPVFVSAIGRNGSATALACIRVTVRFVGRPTRFPIRIAGCAILATATSFYRKTGRS